MTAENHLPLNLPHLSNSCTNSKAPALQIESQHDSPLSPNFPPPSDCIDDDAEIQMDDDAEIQKVDDADDTSYVVVPRNDDSPLPLDQHLDASDPPVPAHSHHPIDLLNGKLAKTTSGDLGDRHQIDSSESSSAPSENAVSVLDLDASDPLEPAHSHHPIDLLNGKLAKTTSGDLGDRRQIDSSESSLAPSENAVSVLDLDSKVDLVDSTESQAEPKLTSLDVTKSTDVCQKSQEDGSDSIIQLQDIQLFPLSSLVPTPAKPSELEVSKPNSASQQHWHSFDDVGGAQESEIVHSDTTQCEPQQPEVQNENLEEQIGKESAAEAEERMECLVPPMVTKASEASESDTSGPKDEEETKIQLSEAKENQETIIRPGSNLDRGIAAENSVNEVDLLSVAATACVPVLHENSNTFPVSSFDGCVPDIKESNDYVDESETCITESDRYTGDCETRIHESIECANDKEKPFELYQSSANADTSVPATSCLERETDIVDNPLKSVANLQNSAKEHEFQRVASHLKENVIADSDGACKCKTEDTRIKQVPDISTEHEIEHAACSPSENVVIDTDEVIETKTDPVSSVSGNLDGAISSLGGTARLEIKSNDVNDDFVGGKNIQSCFANTTISRTESEDKMSTFKVDDLHSETVVTTLDSACADTHCISSVIELKSEVGNYSDIGCRDMPCSDIVASQIEVSDGSIVISESVPNLVPEIMEVDSQGDKLSDAKSNDKLLSQGSKDMEQSYSNVISACFPESSIADASAGQDVDFGHFTRSFHFLIRVPKFDDSKVREQIQHAQLQVEEKTKHRDAFRLESQKLKANCHGHAAEYEAAVSKAKASKKLVNSKRAEIDYLQSKINEIKNAISVKDINARIDSMEYMIQHETLPLKEEKQFIREINQLNKLREQLSSNIGSQDEVQEALDKRDEIEERLKILKKELENLKDCSQRAEAVAWAAKKKYEDENKKLKELKSQVEAANDIRQAAYHHFQSLKSELSKKNKQFRTYKDNAAAAADYAASKDRGALHHLCVNQVETIMNLWNNNDDFRKEYVNCNIRSTLRRLGTLDGHSLGPDEERPVLPSYMVERMARSVSNRANRSPIFQNFHTQILEQENPSNVVEDVSANDISKEKEVESEGQKTKTGESVKPYLGNGLATISGRHTSNDEISEEEQMPTREELQLMRKAEELRKEEAAAKLRELRRLEEKAKALEALERKKKIAEKAQMRAELRAQKEAELREKEREKRLRKKERKKAGGSEVTDGNAIGESTPSSESLTQTIKEPEIKDASPVATAKRSQRPSFLMKQIKTKSMPPPLRNRGKRKMQQWAWVTFSCAAVIVLFFLGNIGFFFNFRQRSYGF